MGENAALVCLATLALVTFLSSLWLAWATGGSNIAFAAPALLGAVTVVRIFDV